MSCCNNLELTTDGWRGEVRNDALTGIPYPEHLLNPPAPAAPPPVVPDPVDPGDGE